MDSYHVCNHCHLVYCIWSVTNLNFQTTQGPLYIPSTLCLIPTKMVWCWKGNNSPLAKLSIYLCSLVLSGHFSPFYVGLRYTKLDTTSVLSTSYSKRASLEPMGGNSLLPKYHLKSLKFIDQFYIENFFL